MNLKPIKTDADHKAALHEIERLWDAKEGTANGDRLDILITLVEAYEEAHFPMDLPDPIEAIKFRLEQQGAEKKVLIGIIGNRTLVPDDDPPTQSSSQDSGRGSHSPHSHSEEQESRLKSGRGAQVPILTPETR